MWLASSLGQVLSWGRLKAPRGCAAWAQDAHWLPPTLPCIPLAEACHMVSTHGVGSLLRPSRLGEGVNIRQAVYHVVVNLFFLWLLGFPFSSPKS